MVVVVVGVVLVVLGGLVVQHAGCRAQCAGRGVHVQRAGCSAPGPASQQQPAPARAACPCHLLTRPTLNPPPHSAPRSPLYTSINALHPLAKTVGGDEGRGR